MKEGFKPKPEWLKRPWKKTEETQELEGLIDELGLNTVCREASCPNYSECFERGTATFMILGAVCTRNCGFCGVTHSAPELVDPNEPERVAEAVKKLNLDYVVITSVTRDDLDDGGAEHFAKTVRAIREKSPKTKIETLIPDFAGSEEALAIVIEAAPDVISHNMETVKTLYDKVRPEADYQRSLEVIKRIAQSEGEIKAKSGIMVGVGETNEQVLELMDDLRKVDCNILTIGQYLRPSKENIPVEKYIEPETFDHWAEEAREKGFEFVASAPFVRSSYHAGEVFKGEG